MEHTCKFVMSERVSECSASPLLSTMAGVRVSPGSGVRASYHRDGETADTQECSRVTQPPPGHPHYYRTAHRVGAMHAREILATRCVVACVGANESTSPVMIIMQRLSLCRLGGSVVKFSQGAYQSPRRPFLRHRPFSYRAPWRSSRSTSRRLRSLSRACRAASSAS